MRLGPVHIVEVLIILVVVLIIFGPKRLPEMARGLGQSVREFRKSVREMKSDFEEETAAKPTPVKKAEAETSEPQA
jgi:sec-independent protein translocase protein TatA